MTAAAEDKNKMIGFLVIGLIILVAVTVVSKHK